jgi:protein TonB
MNESITPIERSPFDASAQGYALSDDLARLCLPSQFKDSYRRLAWVDSICLLFLIIGLIGLKAPPVVERPVVPPTENVPVVFTPPEEQPKPEVAKPDEPPPPDTPLEAPQVAIVVAAADPSQVAFAVPVEGAVAVAPARFATPPPPVGQMPRAAIKFDPNAGGGGITPPPNYPGYAQRNRYQGTVRIDFIVDASGAIISARVTKSSGYPILDEAALEVVKSRWHFPPGPERPYYWECTFKMPD